jgi:hypothetical protein
MTGGQIYRRAPEWSGVASLRFPIIHSGMPIMARLALAGLMAAIVALGIATSGGPVCRSAASRNHAGQVRSARCQSTANGLPK